jgi:hypothetical protein
LSATNSPPSILLLTRDQTLPPLPSCPIWWWFRYNLDHSISAPCRAGSHELLRAVDRRAISEMNLKIVPVNIGDRTVYRHVLAHGLAGTELEPKASPQWRSPTSTDGLGVSYSQKQQSRSGVEQLREETQH